MVSACSSNSTNSKEDTNSTVVSTKNASDITCKVRPKTGSRVPQKICKTPQQLAEDERQAKVMMDGLNRGNGVKSN